VSTFPSSDLYLVLELGLQVILFFNQTALPHVFCRVIQTNWPSNFLYFYYCCLFYMRHWRHACDGMTYLRIPPTKYFLAQFFEPNNNPYFKIFIKILFRQIFLWLNFFEPLCRTTIKKYLWTETKPVYLVAVYFYISRLGSTKKIGLYWINSFKVVCFGTKESWAGFLCKWSSFRYSPRRFSKLTRQ
jgi:hypothetical protein